MFDEFGNYINSRDAGAVVDAARGFGNEVLRQAPLVYDRINANIPDAVKERAMQMRGLPGEVVSAARPYVENAADQVFQAGESFGSALPGQARELAGQAREALGRTGAAGLDAAGNVANNVMGRGRALVNGVAGDIFDAGKQVGSHSVAHKLRQDIPQLGEDIYNTGRQMGSQSVAHKLLNTPVSETFNDAMGSARNTMGAAGQGLANATQSMQSKIAALRSNAPGDIVDAPMPLVPNSPNGPVGPQWPAPALLPDSPLNPNYVEGPLVPNSPFGPNGSRPVLPLAPDGPLVPNSPFGPNGARPVLPLAPDGGDEMAAQGGRWNRLMGGGAAAGGAGLAAGINNIRRTPNNINDALAAATDAELAAGALQGGGRITAREAALPLAAGAGIAGGAGYQEYRNRQSRQR
jgi:hypothetical protein